MEAAKNIKWCNIRPQSRIRSHCKDTAGAESAHCRLLETEDMMDCHGLIVIVLIAIIALILGLELIWGPR